MAAPTLMKAMFEWSVGLRDAEISRSCEEGNPDDETYEKFSVDMNRTVKYFCNLTFGKSWLFDSYIAETIFVSMLPRKRAAVMLEWYNFVNGLGEISSDVEVMQCCFAFKYIPNDARFLYLSNLHVYGHTTC